MNTASPSRSRHVVRWTLTGIIAAASVLLGVYSSAGIQGSGHKSLRAFGRATVLGTTIQVSATDYSASDAQVQIDGAQGKLSQIKNGQVVSIRGIQGSGKRLAIATDVGFTGNVRGAISAVDVSGSRLFPLGQTIDIDAATILDPNIGTALADLPIGAEVEVSAFVTSSGELLASYVGLVESGADARVSGAVQRLDTQAHTFSIN